MVNVKEDDPFRFQLVDVDGQQSNRISVYDIHHTEGFRIPYSLKIVVTPYFGEDSGQLFRDQKVAETFNAFLEDKYGIQELDMICNLVISSTGYHRQPFLSIFGKDVEKNINNWELTEDFLSDNRLCKTLIHHFFSVLATMKPKSLSSTKLVLDERKKMKGALNDLQSLITIGLTKLVEIKKIEEMTKYFQSQIEKEIQQVNYVPSNLSVSTVTRFWSLPQINTCHFDIHPNSRKRYDSGIYKVFYEAEKKLKDIQSKGQYSVRLMQNDLFRNGTSVLKHFQLIWRCIQHLNRIALHGNSFLTQKVFDILFEAEQHLKQLGFTEQLERMKKTGN
jgi:hypothetical protein